MFAKLLPRSAPYFKYFEQQNSIMQEMAKLLIAIVDAEQNAEGYLKRMEELEAEADELQHTIIHELSQTFITPIDREDIYAVSTAQERAIDGLNGLGARFFLFSFVHMRFPAQKMIANIHEMTHAIGDLLQCLRDKREPSGPVAAMHGLKENCEMLVGVGLGELQDSETSSFDQVKQLMVWDQLYDRIEQTVLLFAELTDTLEQAVLKYA